MTCEVTLHREAPARDTMIGAWNSKEGVSSAHTIILWVRQQLPERRPSSRADFMDVVRTDRRQVLMLPARPARASSDDQVTGALRQELPLAESRAREELTKVLRNRRDMPTPSMQGPSDTPQALGALRPSETARSRCSGDASLDRQRAQAPARLLAVSRGISLKACVKKLRPTFQPGGRDTTRRA